MRKRYPDILFLRQTEEESVCTTRNYFGEEDWRFEFITNQLLMLPFFNGTLEDGDSDRGKFQHYSVGHYLQFPYTLLSAHKHWRTAYYLEASILLRHLLEIFVQMRYFEKQPPRLLPHLKDKSRKDRVSFWTMFEALRPGSYEPLYKRLLSQFAHGKANLVFRSDLIQPGPDFPTGGYQPKTGCEFNAGLSVLLHAFMIGVVLGLINHHAVIFPLHTVASDPQFEEDLADTRLWLELTLNTAKNRGLDSEFSAALESLVSL